jgi:hypothetical protein
MSFPVLGNALATPVTFNPVHRAIPSSTSRGASKNTACCKQLLA